MSQFETPPSEPKPAAGDTSLDPQDWSALRAQGHRMLDDMLDHLQTVARRPVWQAAPESARAAFDHPLPLDGMALDQAHQHFMQHVAPYSVGNAHPGFMGWVHGGGTAVGMLADMLAAGLNANVGGRNQMPVQVERQVVRWMRELFQFPDSANGVFVTGSSQANAMGVLLARTHHLGLGCRSAGIARAAGPHLVAYAATTAHGCIEQAMDLCGLGTQALRRVPVNAQHQMDTAALQRMMAADRVDGLQPFLLVGSAGTVDVGAIDDLAALADIAQHENVWLHVDGALGALGMWSARVAPLLHGIERADSLALDFHKWGQVPYDAGFFLARDGHQQLDTFSSPQVYLSRAERGLAAGSPWPCDLGPDLSRGFRALKTWFTIATFGTRRLGQVVEHTCALARYLEQRVRACPALELLAPVALNIVCFRYLGPEIDTLNADIVADLHESGLAAPSLTRIGAHAAIRCAIVNHRTTAADIDILFDAVLAFGRERSAKATALRGLGLAPLARMAFEGQALQPLANTLLERAQSDPQDAHALLDLSVLLQLQGEHELALSTQQLALAQSRLYEWPSSRQASLRLLALMAPGDLMANAPIQFLLEDSDVALQTLYLMPDEPLPSSLPEHDVALVAISQSSVHDGLLSRLAPLVDAWPRPVLLHPQRIRQTERTAATALLSAIPGVRVAAVRECMRLELLQWCASRGAAEDFLPGTPMPWIIRPLDSHAGHGLTKIADRTELDDYLHSQHGHGFVVSEFVDYRDADIQYRKYRVVLIDGVAYPVHMAISSHWMVHYLNAGMTESRGKRDEEAVFLAGFDSGFGLRHAAALESIAAAFGLEYLVLDCAQTRDGALLVFEVDPGAVVHAMDSAEMFPYKHAAMERIFDAYRALLHRAAARGAA